MNDYLYLSPKPINIFFNKENGLFSHFSAPLDFCGKSWLAAPLVSA